MREYSCCSPLAGNGIYEQEREALYSRLEKLKRNPEAEIQLKVHVRFLCLNVKFLKSYIGSFVFQMLSASTPSTANSLCAEVCSWCDLRSRYMFESVWKERVKFQSSKRNMPYEFISQKISQLQTDISRFQGRDLSKWFSMSPWSTRFDSVSEANWTHR